MCDFSLALAVTSPLVNLFHIGRLVLKSFSDSVTLNWGKSWPAASPAPNVATTRLSQHFGNIRDLMGVLIVIKEGTTSS